MIQFPAGLSELVEQVAQNEFADLRVRYADDSAMVFDTRDRISSADDIPFAKNVFLIQAETNRRGLGPSIAALAADLRPMRSPGSAGYRLMYHVDGQLVAADPGARRALEHAVGRATGLRPMPRGQCLEFWVIARRESPLLYLAERLPGRGAQPARGSLSPELSALLVAAGEPHSDDVFLDPFAGSGALVRARLRTPARSVIYNDLELDHHRDNFQPPMPRKVRLLGEDALRLPSVPTGTVDVVVTDPPWGEHDDSLGDYGDFAKRMAASLKRVLKPGSGRLVILVNRRNEDVLTEALTAHAMKIYDAFQLLVNGHPASAIRAQA
jgi:SAM-dependent methyltransferase